MIDATYAYGFGRLQGVLPPDTFGGFPGDYYSSGYNAGYGHGRPGQLGPPGPGDPGLRVHDRATARAARTRGGRALVRPSTSSPWIGRHPGTGQGSSPHAWGMAGANKVLLDSLVAQASDGDLVVGRGVPATWLTGGPPIAVHQLPVPPTGDG